MNTTSKPYYTNSEFWTMSEAMDYLKVKSRKTMYTKYINTGLLPAYKRDKNIRGINLFKADDVRKLVKPLDYEPEK